ncbi:MAG: hypothetical protein PVJ34_05065 [Anaerolineae bacterium]|jgi:hypothetical protein
MKTVRTLVHLARADLLERVRCHSFLLVLASTVFAGYLFVPPVDAGYRVLQVGTQRGIYDSAWIGLMFGLIAALHLPLVGFYLVKHAVERDRRTGVGQIIATTPTGKLVYVAGKWLSNLVVLALILSAMTAMAVVMQLVRAEDTTIRLGAMIATVWLMGLPVLAIAAALAVLFECIPFLRGGFGNVLFFFSGSLPWSRCSPDRSTRRQASSSLAPTSIVSRGPLPAFSSRYLRPIRMPRWDPDSLSSNARLRVPLSGTG